MRMRPHRPVRPALAPCPWRRWNTSSRGRTTCIQLLPAPGQRLIVNPGSVGQPRDNDARAAYAILDLEMMIWEYVRVPYPIELTQSQMRAARLPKRLIDRLGFGW